MHKHSSDEQLGSLAGRQHGVVAVGQLRALGFDKSAVSRRAAAGRLHRLHRGVYAVGHTALTERSRLMAAVLAAGRRAALSHRSAAQLWGILRPGPIIEATSPRRCAPAGTLLIHCSPLTPEDRGTIDGIPVTSLARTIVDLADVLPEKRLTDVVHEAEVRRLFDLTAIEAAQARVPGRRGRHRLKRVLAAWQPRLFTRSEAERRFLDLCKRHGLPTPSTGVNVAGYETDFLFADVNVVVEIDGAAAHQTRKAFEEDRRRDRILAAHGLHVVRATWRDLEGDGRVLAEELDALLASIWCRSSR